MATGETSCTSTLLSPFCWLTNWGFAHDRAFLDTRQLSADLLRLRLFYRRRGYRSVRVDTAVDRLNGRARVTFRVEEGDPTRIDTLRITGLDGEIAGDRVRQLVPLSAGDPLDLTRLQSGENEVVTEEAARKIESLGVDHEHRPISRAGAVWHVVQIGIELQHLPGWRPDSVSGDCFESGCCVGRVEEKHGRRGETMGKQRAVGDPNSRRWAEPEQSVLRRFQDLNVPLQNRTPL